MNQHANSTIELTPSWWRMLAAVCAIAAMLAIALQIALRLPPEAVPSPVTLFICSNWLLAAAFATRVMSKSSDPSFKLTAAIAGLAAAFATTSWIVDWTSSSEAIQDSALIVSWLLLVATAAMLLRREETTAVLRNLLVLASLLHAAAVLIDALEPQLVDGYGGDSTFGFSYALAACLSAAAYNLAMIGMAFPAGQAPVGPACPPVSGPAAAAGSAAWSPEDARDLLAAERYGYQRIPLPFGLSTDGHSRQGTAAKIFPADLSGKSVADVGCNHGYFCFEAKRRGAASVTGFDIMPKIVRRARKLGKILGADVQFEVRNIDRQPLTGHYDLILCLNVLHHVDDPIAVLDNLVAAAKETLILEIAGLNLFDYFKRLDVVPFFAFLMARSPVIYIGKVSHKPGAPGDGKLKYYITRTALLRLLRRYQGDFASIEVRRSSYKGRFLVTCRKDSSGQFGHDGL